MLAALLFDLRLSLHLFYQLSGGCYIWAPSARPRVICCASQALTATRWVFSASAGLMCLHDLLLPYSVDHATVSGRLGTLHRTVKAVIIGQVCERVPPLGNMTC